MRLDLWKLLSLLLLFTPTASAQEQLDASEIFLGTADCRLSSGSGSPEGSITAPPCSLYLRSSDGQVWRKSSGTGNTGWETVGLSATLGVGSGGTGLTTATTNGVLYGNGTSPLGVTSAPGANTVFAGNSSTPFFTTTPTITSLTATSQVSAPTLHSTGDLTLDPDGFDVLPQAGYTVNLGAVTNKYLAAHIAELNVGTLVAQDVMSTVGGRIVVAPTTRLASDLTNVATSISTQHNNLASGDRIVMESGGQVEWMAVTSSAGGGGPYTYSVTRDLDGSGANTWSAGDAVMNTGTTGDGFIDAYADNGILPGTTVGPTIVGNVRTGTTYSNIEPRWAIGNLNGLYGYATDTYAVALGSPAAAWVKIDPTNGVRLGHNTTTNVQVEADGDATFNGAITAESGEIGGLTITTTSLRTSDGAITVDSHGGAASDVYVALTGTGSASTSYASSVVDNWTIGGWFMSTDATPAAEWMGLCVGGLTNGYCIQQHTSGEWRGRLGGVGYVGSHAIAAGTWVHLVLRRSGGTSQLFVDGVAGGTLGSAPSAPSGDISIGINGYEGGVSHVFFAERALTDEEIEEIATGLPAHLAQTRAAYLSQSTPFYYYPLNVGSSASHPRFELSGEELVSSGLVFFQTSGPSQAESVASVQFATSTGNSAVGIARSTSGTDVALWAGTSYANRVNAPLRVLGNGDVQVEAGIYEQDRTVLMGGWTSYTPTWSSSGTAVALGNGTITGSYTQIGDTVHFRVTLIMGTTTTYGTGVYSFTLPVTSTSVGNAVMAVGTSIVFDSSGGTYHTGTAKLASTTTAQVVVDATGAVLGQTAPVTFATSDQVGIEGTYTIP